METQLYSNDLREGARLRTRHPMVIYLDTAGSDDGDGSAEHPYATWTKAFEQIPLCIEHRVSIKAKAGTYTGFPKHLRHQIGPGGILSLEGMDAPTTVAGPFTLTGVTAVGIDAGLDLTVLGAGWAADQFYGQFIRFTSGAAQNLVMPIGYSAGDVISVARHFPLPAVGDTFIVVEPSTKIICEEAPVFSLRGDGVAGRRYATWVMANLEFETNLTGYVPGYTVNEDIEGIWGMVKFVGLDPWTLFSQKSGAVNLSIPRSEFLASPVIEDISLIVMDWGTAWSGVGSVQMTAGPVPPVVATGWYEIVGSDVTERGVGIYDLACRSGVYITGTCNGELTHLFCAFIDVDHHAKGGIFNSRVKAAGFGKHAIRVDDGSHASIANVYIDSSSKSGVIVEDGSFVELSDFGGATANIVDYGILMTRLARVICDGTVDLEGLKGKVRFNQTDTTVDYPVAKSAETDGQGSFISK